MVVPELYLNWLRWNKEREGFQNSIYYALLAHHLFEIQNQNCTFKMPIHILSRELEAEERQQQASTIIRKYVIHLLEIATGEQITHKNYEEEMFKYFENHRSLRGAEGLNPLVKERSFHSISSESKMYCISYLLTNCQVVMLDSLTLLETDTLKNNFFIVNGGLLFVQMGKQLQELVEKDDGDEELTPFDLYLRNVDRWQLVAESEGIWRNVVPILKNFKQQKVANALKRELESAIAAIPTSALLKQERSQFDSYLESLEPKKKKVSKSEATAEAPSGTPPSREPEPTSGRNSPEPSLSNQEVRSTRRVPRRQYESSEDEEAPQPAVGNAGRPTERADGRARSPTPPVVASPLNNSSSQNDERATRQQGQPRAARSASRGRVRSSSRVRFAAGSARGPTNMNQRNHESVPDLAFQQPAQVPTNTRTPTQRKKCLLFPRCPNTNCPDAHPTVPCTYGTWCNKGRECNFFHGYCEDDGRCVNEWCFKLHDKQTNPELAAKRNQ